ncbi:low molecular weight phosphotyrosine protein phosphatase [Candidatus Poribacteria bacterium]|nr:low molecular weight phosphotyrosine protein phosphatase [Candidatus Poribacteria bacterium]
MTSGATARTTRKAPTTTFTTGDEVPAPECPLPQHRVLFVCMGNICRSPAGEGVFRAFVESHGLAKQFHIESAGTIGFHEGELPDFRMREAAARRGYQLTSHARQFTAADFDRFDLIVAMDRANRADLLSNANADGHAQKVRLLTSFHPNPGTDDVPDPYYGGKDGFERVLDLIEGACPGILAQLEPGSTP